MHNNRLATFLFLAALPAIGQTPPSVVRLHRHDVMGSPTIRPDGSSTSTNWSGYAGTSSFGTITDVKASWTVPTVSCSAPQEQAAALWVGIDGYASGTVEQTGTESECLRGKPNYFAWYEFVPTVGATTIDMDIQPGDQISAEVAYSDRHFVSTITNQRTGQTFSFTASVPTARRSSAEWIVETPSSRRGFLPFPDFGTAYFGPDFTGIANSTTATISGQTLPLALLPNLTAITLVTSDGITLAVPSPLTPAGTSFTVAQQ